MARILQEFGVDQQTDLVIVSFVIRGEALQPSTITTELGLPPSWSFSKGELYMARSINPETREIVYVSAKRPWGIWAIDTKQLVNNKEVQDHILHLLYLLEPKRKELNKYLKQKDVFQIGLSITWSSVEGNFGSYEINSELLAKVSKLSHYVEFDFLGKTNE